MSSNIQLPKNCLYCGKNFIAKTTVTKYCSLNCNRRHYKQRMREEKIQAALERTQEQIVSGNDKTRTASNISNKPFLSIKEAAVLLGASRWTVQKLLKKGIISRTKIGRRTIIPRSEIDKLFS